jgi:hypothetical protein
MKRKFVLLPALLLAFVLFGCDDAIVSSSRSPTVETSNIVASYVGVTTADNQVVTINILKETVSLSTSTPVSASVFAATGNPYVIRIGNVVKSEGTVTVIDATLHFIAGSQDNTYPFNATFTDRNGNTIKFDSDQVRQSDGTYVGVGEFNNSNQPFVNNPLNLPSDDDDELINDDTNDNDVVLAPSYLLLTDNTTKVDLAAEDLAALVASEAANVTLTGSREISKASIKEAVFGYAFNSVTAIPDNFLAGFTSLTYIDISGFSSLSTIGNNFLSGCTSFNTDIVIPATVNSVGEAFLFGCDNMRSFVYVKCEASAFSTPSASFATTNAEALLYTQGIKLSGLDETIIALRDRFPDSETTIYRKLLDIVTRPVEQLPPDNTLQGTSDASATSYITYGEGVRWVTGPRDQWGIADSWLEYYPVKTIQIEPNHLPRLCSATQDYITLTNVRDLDDPDKPIIPSVTIDRIKVTTVVIGNDFSNYMSIPSNFLYYFENLQSVDLKGFSNARIIGDKFMNRCKKYNEEIKLPEKLSSIGNDFMKYCGSFNSPLTIPDTVTSIGDNFLNSCTKFDSTLTLSQNLTRVGHYFLSWGADGTPFNQPLTLPNSLAYIGQEFMSRCYKFNQPLTIPASVGYAGRDFFMNCYAMTSTITINCSSDVFDGGMPTDDDRRARTDNSYSFAVANNSGAPSFVTGVRITGPGVGVVNKFPNTSANNKFRNLIVQ